MTVVVDTTHFSDEYHALKEIKTWIIQEYDYRGRFKHNPSLSWEDNMKWDVAELIEHLNDNFCLIGYRWELVDNRLEYNEE